MFIKEPMLYVFETAERTIWEFEHWQYNEYRGKAADSRDRSERPQDKDDHMMENLGRAFLNPIQFTEMPKYNERQGSQGDMPMLDPYDTEESGNSLIEL